MGITIVTMGTIIVITTVTITAITGPTTAYTATIDPTGTIALGVGAAGGGN
jgi:hypothetical protein